MKRGRYYLGRIIKLGTLDQPKLMQAIRESTKVTVGKFTWTITNVTEGEVSGCPFIMGRLSKYAQEGHVTVVDEEQRLERAAIAPRLLRASSPFMYMPEFSGIAYMHVWNEIATEVFRKRFKDVIDYRIICFGRDTLFCLDTPTFVVGHCEITTQKRQNQVTKVSEPIGESCPIIWWLTGTSSSQR